MRALQNQSVWTQWVNRSLRDTGWAPLVVFIIHVIALGVYDGYTLIASLDAIMHFIGGMVMAYFLHGAFINASRLGIIGPHHRITHRLLVFTATCTVAVFWEFAEFILDETLGTFSQAGLGDTMSDLFFGFLGAGVFALLLTVIATDSVPLLSRAMQKLKNVEDAVSGE